MNLPEPPARVEEELAASSPTGTVVPHFKPRDRTGWLYLASCSGLTALALTLSALDYWPVWLLGQCLFAVALLQWFVLLHETGHHTLFRTPWLNRGAGHVAGFFAGIPFPCWKLVHGIHHHWTGWQDLDLTTANLVPRPLSRLERLLVNLCWTTGLPLFSTLYRINNYWNLFRLKRYFPDRRQRRQLLRGVVVMAAVYALVVGLVGPELVLQLVGLGLFLTLVLQDPLILSQHTHVPMERSSGSLVQPFLPRDQAMFTRSLEFPAWFARLILLNFDAHELHHMYPRVPGYDLHRIDYVQQNRICWWRWLLQAKRLSGEVFLFQNRLQSGHHL